MDKFFYGSNPPRQKNFFPMLLIYRKHPAIFLCEVFLLSSFVKVKLQNFFFILAKELSLKNLLVRIYMSKWVLLKNVSASHVWLTRIVDAVFCQTEQRNQN